MLRLPIRHLPGWRLARRHHPDTGHPDTWVIKYRDENGNEAITSNIVCWKCSRVDENLIVVRTHSFRRNAYDEFYISLADAATPVALLAFQTDLAKLEWRG